METDTRLSSTEPSENRILIVDDDDFQLKVLEQILSKDGYQVFAFNNATKALDFAFTQIPDMVLSDLMMPDMDGFEVIHRLKEDHRTQSVPIILITAFDDRRSESKGLAFGAVDYIVKPLVAPIVKARVRTHLELKRHRDNLERLVRQRTEELIHSRQQFQDLVEKSLVGIAIFQDRKVVYQNPELERIVPGLSEKIHQQDISFVHPDDLVKAKQAYLRLNKQLAPHVVIDLRVIGVVSREPATPETWINCRAVFFTYQGKLSILVNVADISHTKELERLLLIRNKMASLGRIASGMAHEIRNPLTGITSYLYTLEQLCQTQTLLPKDIELMQDITSQLKLASHKVDAVIKRVLDFAKPTAPRMVSIDLNRCLDNVIQLTAVTLRKAGVSVTRNLSAELPACYGDMGLMEQVILNLVQNAAHALRQAKGDKQIAVSSSFDEEFAFINIDDCGPGVPPELREKIFDPFFTTSSEGSGIGLSIAHRIVNDHHGDLHVGDSPLGGARFQIIIPLEKRTLKR
jgi:signal transduction histidine kinase